MATPGRTHIPWQTQTGQVQELISYIGYLEAKLQYLQLHHETCDKWNTPLPDVFSELSYLPPDLIMTYDESQQSPTQSFSVVDTNVSPPVQTSPKSSANIPRWKRIVDQMTKGWDQRSGWMDRRIAIGLDSVEKNHLALTMLLDLKIDFPGSEDTDLPAQLLNASLRGSVASQTLIMSARQYALGTKASERQAGFVVQLHNFRELIFASLCVVIEHQGLPIDTINDLMRICMSSSGAANLYRLRRGALWVNRVIAGLIRKGWHHGATEFFLLCKTVTICEVCSVH